MRWKHQSPRLRDAKEGDVASSPSPLVESKRSANIGTCLPRVNHSCSHPHCMYYVAMSASSNSLEASMPAFANVKEGDVASSLSPLVESKRSANRYLFAAGKPLPFASPLHVLCCNERFQQHAGSINPCICGCKRERRCLVALSALKQQKIGKQVFACRCEIAPIRIPRMC